ncbi:Cobalt-zinc-cadmium resistance protein CzcB [Stieleria bergensis]|uniref:Cobalt-zinc-cadmium resistance protein CzcB n=1 Tax=Stieleria bergensis TaxID=2528025 RepID=A0A517SW23_9BACT|nr:Cobalt-zinc-cadmium resistance protein CzcB [Planctomycetes bacterium SV_7m_r]
MTTTQRSHSSSRANFLTQTSRALFAKCRFTSSIRATTLALASGLCVLPVAAQSPSQVNRVSRSTSTGLDTSYSSRSKEYIGYTIPSHDVMVAATEIGRLGQVQVKIGDRVKKQQVLASLEDGLQREAVTTAKWRSEMRGEMDAAKAEVNLAKLRLEQLERLAQQDVARPDEVIRARADVEIAESRYLTAVEDRKLRQLDLSRYEMQLKRRNIYAPFDGVVSEIFHQPGEYITPADPAVVRLVVLDELYAVFNIPAQDINVFEVGSKVSLVLTTTPKPVTGVVDAITPQIDGESGTIKMQVLIKNPEGRFRAGDRCRLGPTGQNRG